MEGVCGTGIGVVYLLSKNDPCAESSMCIGGGGEVGGDWDASSVYKSRGKGKQGTDERARMSAPQSSHVPGEVS